MASTIEGRREQAEAAIAHLISEAQLAARGAAPARLWAVCAAGIAGVHPAKLKRLGRHKSFDVLGGYRELGDLFERHSLTGVL